MPVGRSKVVRITSVTAVKNRPLFRNDIRSRRAGDIQDIAGRDGVVVDNGTV